MHEFSSEIVQKNRLLPGIHGLRGIAALCVVLYHLIHVGTLTPPSVFGFIGQDFGYSVHLFFIVSAYSLMYSTEPKINEPFWLTGYFLKRFFRIAPLFYFVIALMILTGRFSITGLNEITRLILNLTFTFGFAPASGMVWGGWSVGAEMIFYAIFPVLLLTIKTHRSAFIFVIISIIVSCGLRSELHQMYLSTGSSARYDWSYFSFVSNICFFSMGIYAYLLNKQQESFGKLITIYAPIIATVILGLSLFSDFDKLLSGFGRLDIVFWGIGLTALCIWQSAAPSKLISSWVFEYLGERSFSVYLLHPVIIYFSKQHIVRIYDILKPALGFYGFFVCAALIFAVILFFAEFTYRLIEVPGIWFGQRLITQWKNA